MVRPRRKNALLRPGLGLLGALIALGIWQLTAVAGSFGNALPTATETIGRFVELLGTATFWHDAGLTVAIALTGLGISAVLGVLLGVLMGSSRVIRAATLAIFEFLKPIPPIVVLPLMVMVLGPTTPMALVLVVIGCALGIAMQTMAGVADTDPVALSTARSYGLGRGETMWRIVLPSAGPFIGTAMRVSAPASLVVTVVAGLLGGAPGLGRSIYQAQAAGNYATLYALVAVLGILGLVFQGVAESVEAKVLHWHPSHREVKP
ncbi:ABC transporter permease [Paeniglutamicibacter cryotolerans]